MPWQSGRPDINIQITNQMPQKVKNIWKYLRRSNPAHDAPIGQHRLSAQEGLGDLRHQIGEGRNLVKNQLTVRNFLSQIVFILITDLRVFHVYPRRCERPGLLPALAARPPVRHHHAETLPKAAGLKKDGAQQRGAVFFCMERLFNYTFKFIEGNWRLLFSKHLNKNSIIKGKYLYVLARDAFEPPFFELEPNFQMSNLSQTKFQGSNFEPNGTFSKSQTY